jgi:predicted Zn finger-like uncharacterized protein
MNWITRCPECATVYQVVPDQLQAAKGWLRCGQCQHTFDSTGLVIFWPDTALSVARRLPSGAEVQNDASVPERVDIEALLKQEDRSGADIASNASADLKSFEQALSSFKPEIEKALEQLAAGPLLPSAAENDSEMDEPLMASPTIQRRWLPALMACVLLMTFLGQWIWIDRHALATRWPALDGYFKSVCTAVACESEFTREIDGLVIDTSSFIQRDGVFELQWIIRNTASKVVMMTALELTLQDAQGRPVLRRVFLPREVGAPNALEPAQTWEGRLLLGVPVDMAVTGYRVLSFYP